MQATTIGLDIAKSVFQVHGVDAAGRTVLRKRLTRGKVLAFFANLPPCVIGLEACGGAHFRARELQALGHDARLMPPQYVKAYVKTNKHDAADAEACCEAVQRPGMRFVAVKSAEQQAMTLSTGCATSWSGKSGRKQRRARSPTAGHDQRATRPPGADPDHARSGESAP